MRPRLIVKTIATFLALMSLINGLKAQPAAAPTNSSPTVPVPARTTNREEAIQQALQRAYAQATNANSANPSSPASTNAAVGLPTNAFAISTNFPSPALTNALTPSTPTTAVFGPTNVTAGALTNLAVRATNVTTAASTNTVRAGLPAFPAAPPPRNPSGRVATPVGPGAPASPPGVPPGLGAVAGNPAAGLPGAVAANPGDGGEEEVFPPGLIKFQDADLVQVLDVYQELTGRTVMRPNSLPAAKITIRSQTPLTRQEAIQALDSILSLNQITMIPQGTKFVKAVPQGQASQEAARFSTNASSTLPEAGQFITQIVKLTNAAPKDIAQALQPFAKMPNSIIGIDSAGILVLRDYAENVKRMMEVLEQIDVVPLQEFEPVVIPIKYALAGDIAQVLGTLTSGGGGGTTTVGRQQTRTGLTTGGGAGGAGGLPGQGGFGQQGGYPGQQQGLNQQGGISGAGLGSSAANRSSFQDRLRQIVNRAASGGEIVVLGQTKIIADERTNSLLIFASKQDIATIKDIIAKLDVVLAQVLIEAVILEVTLGDDFELGFDYLQKGHSIGPVKGSSSINRPLPIPDATSAGTNALGSLGGAFNYFAKLDKYNLEASLTAKAMDSRVRILSRPRVQTSHAVEANLFVGRTRPYPTSSGYGGFGGSYNTIQQLQIGITLSVLPLINPDGLVVMDIRQKIQDVGKDIEIMNVGSIPETIEREANAKVAVRDGETVMLGGFISSSRNDSKSGVPFLKDIPVLGYLFRSTTRKNDRVELMVFVRPTVLPTPEIAAMVATREKKNLPAIWRAEQEELEELQKTRDEADKKAAKDLNRREGFNAQPAIQP